LTITGKLDVQKLCDVLEGVTNWYQLGIKLGILPAKLRKIEENYRGNDRRKTETLDTWLQQTPNASWSNVVGALQQMGENTVAESVQQQYIGAVASEFVYAFSLSNPCTPLQRMCECVSAQSRVKNIFFEYLCQKRGNLRMAVLLGHGTKLYVHYTLGTVATCINCK